MAERLAQEGHQVTALREGTDEGKVGDADVCGTKTEFKCLSGEGTASPENRIRERLTKSRGQGTHTIIDASADPRILAADADLGVRKFVPIEARHEARGTLKGSKKVGVRVYGQGYDISYGHAKLEEMRQELRKTQPQPAETREVQSGQEGHTPPTTPSAEQDRPTSRFAIKRPEERSADDDKASSRFHIAKGDEGNSQRRGPSK